MPKESESIVCTGSSKQHVLFGLVFIPSYKIDMGWRIFFQIEGVVKKIITHVAFYKVLESPLGAHNILS